MLERLGPLRVGGICGTIRVGFGGVFIILTYSFASGCPDRWHVLRLRLPLSGFVVSGEDPKADEMPLTESFNPLKRDVILTRAGQDITHLWDFGKRRW